MKKKKKIEKAISFQKIAIKPPEMNFGNEYIFQRF